MNSSPHHGSLTSHFLSVLGVPWFLAASLCHAPTPALLHTDRGPHVPPGPQLHTSRGLACVMTRTLSFAQSGPAGKPRSNQRTNHLALWLSVCGRDWTKSESSLLHLWVQQRPHHKPWHRIPLLPQDSGMLCRQKTVNMHQPCLEFWSRKYPLV